MASDENDPEEAGLAAGHTEASLIDAKAVTTLKNILLKNGGAKPDIKDNDKHPNFDGTIELFATEEGDQKGQPLGTLRVQVKGTMRDLGDEPKYSFSSEKLFNAIRRTGDEIPTLLIVVDLENEIAYWEHLSLPFIENLDGSKTVHLEPSQSIEAGDDSYLSHWREIVEKHHQRIREGEKSRISFQLLREIAEPYQELEEDDVVAVQAFLQVINSELNTTFRPLKERLTGNAYKLGFAYHLFSDDRLSYSLFEIPAGKTDPEIQKLTTGEWTKLLEHVTNYRRVRNNPLRENPQGHAYEELEDRVLKHVDNLGLYHDHSVEFACEFLHSMAHHLHFALGLAPSEVYSVEEVRSAFETYLPTWLSQAIAYMVEHQVNGTTTPEMAARSNPVTGRPEYFDPEHMYRQIVSDEARKQLAQDTVQHLESGEAVPQVGPVGHPKYSPFVALECLAVLEARGVEEIKPVLPSRGEWTAEHWRWDEEDWLAFAREFISLAREDFNAFCIRNFPDIADRLTENWGSTTTRLHAIGFQESPNLGKGVTVFFADLEREDGLIEEPRTLVVEPDDLATWRQENMGEEVYEDLETGTSYIIGSAGMYRIDVSHLNGPVLLDHHYKRLKPELEDWFRAQHDSAG